MHRFIILVVLVVVVVTAVTIYMGSRTFDGLVVDRPYETGLNWDDIQRRQARLGWHVVIDLAVLNRGENEIVVQVADRTGSPLNDADVEVTLSRPSTRAYDRTYRAKPLGNGRYRIVLMVPLDGLWDLRTSASRGADRHTSTERIEAKERPL